jgi:uncharacterized protein (TIGR03503 family)
MSLSLILVAFYYVPCQADDRAIEAMLLLDSSGSMKVNDPLNLRNSAAKLFMRLMGNNDRIGIISFDLYSQILSPLSSLVEYHGLYQLEAAIDTIRSKGLFTNFYPGLQQALTLLSDNNRGWGAGTKKVVILLTDGILDLPTDWKEKEEKVMNRLKEELLPEFQKEDISIFTLAFTKNANQDLLKYFSSQTGGMHYLALSPEELHLVFMDIFEAIKQPLSLPLDNKNHFLIDAGIEEVIIWVSKEEPKEYIFLERPDKKKVLRTSKEEGVRWQSAPKYELITIQTPQIGEWTIHTRESDRKKRKVIILTNLKLETSLKDAQFEQGASPLLTAWLTKDNIKIKNYPFLSEISFKVKIITPGSGQVQTLELYDDGSHYDHTAFDGIFTNRLDPLTLVGNYQLNFLALGKTFHRQRVISFWVKESSPSFKVDQSWFKVSVKPTSPMLESPLFITTSIIPDADILHDLSMKARIMAPRAEKHTVELVNIDGNRYQGLFEGTKEVGLYQVIIEIEGKDIGGKYFSLETEPISIEVMPNPIVSTPEPIDWVKILGQFALGNLIFVLIGYCTCWVIKKKRRLSKKEV